MVGYTGLTARSISLVLFYLLPKLNALKMNMCKVSEHAPEIKLNSASMLISIIYPNQKFFQYTDHELINRALFLEPDNDLDRYSESNSIFLLLLLVLLLFIAITLTDTGIIFRFNVTKR